MKQITVKELQEKATDYLSGNEALEIEHEGEVIGHFYPRKRTKQEKLERDLDRLGKLVEKALTETSMTEDEFANFFDISKPFPNEDEVNSRH